MVGFKIRVRFRGLGLGSGLELRIVLGCGSLYQYSRGAHAEIFSN